MPSDTFHADWTDFQWPQQGLSTTVITHLPALDLFLGGANLVDEKLKKMGALVTFLWLDESLGQSWSCLIYISLDKRGWNKTLKVQRIKEEVNVTQMFISRTFTAALNCKNWWVLAFLNEFSEEQSSSRQIQYLPMNVSLPYVCVNVCF